MAPDRGFGVAGSLSPDLIKVIAREVESASYATFWVNDVPGGDGLAALAAAASVTDHIGLAVGVIALDRRPPDTVISDLRQLDLPADRLIIGVGAGSSPGSLDRVQRGVEQIRQQTSSRVVVGALGPKMLALAGTFADGVLLNWLTPEWTHQSAAAVRAAGAAAGQPPPLIAAYVRTALGPAAKERLAEEATRYERFPSYAAHFNRMGVDAIDTAITGSSPGAIQTGLATYRSIDEIVVRAIATDDSPAAYLTLVQAARTGVDEATTTRSWDEPGSTPS
jgi:alkanesulfonate monooxygenase SsuD/methylene tetrahydromethanopterin reductase-like flavin-dependent oxidoreductase (luciferase family)